MQFRALLNLDFTGSYDANAYEKLKNALIQSGWRWIETSAFVLDTDDLACAWQGIAVVAKQCKNAGRLSALTFHIHGDSTFAGRTPSSAASHRNALVDILALPFPSPSQCP